MGAWARKSLGFWLGRLFCEGALLTALRSFLRIKDSKESKRGLKEVEFTKEFERLSGSRVKMSIKVGAEQVKSAYDALLKKTLKSIQLPGFRRGKVPVSVLERKYGDGLKEQNIGDVVDRSLQEAFSAEDAKDYLPLSYSTPKIDKMPDVAETGDVSFSVTYDVFPKVEVKDFDVEVKVPRSKVSDEDVNQELKTIQERNATVMDAKEGAACEVGNIATVSYSEVADANEVADTRREGFVFTVGSGDCIYKIDDDLVGMKVGEEKTVKKSYGEDAATDELKGRTVEVKFTLTALKVKSIPELDDELAKDVNERYKSLGDLTEDVKGSLEAACQNEIEAIKSSRLLNALSQKNPVEIPESMLNMQLESRYVELARQFGTTSDVLEKNMAGTEYDKAKVFDSWREEAKRDLAGRVIVETLLKEYNIAVTPEEIEAQYQKLAKSSGTTVEEVKKHYEDARSKEYLIEDAKEKKLYDVLYAKVKVVDGDEVAFKDLYKEGR